MPKSKFSGTLNEKIILPDRPKMPSQAMSFLSPDVTYEYRQSLEKYSHEQHIELRKKQAEKIPALYEFYGIDINAPDAKEWLIISLAEDCIPGFQYQSEPSVGRDETWNDLVFLELFFDVEKLKSKNNESADKLKFTTERACKILVKQEPWASRLKAKGYGTVTPKTLQNKYADAKRSFLVKMYIENHGTDNAQELLVKGIVDAIFKKRNFKK